MRLPARSCLVGWRKKRLDNRGLQVKACFRLERSGRLAEVMNSDTVNQQVNDIVDDDHQPGR